MDYFNHFIESYVHNGGIGVLVELDISNPIATRTDVFRRLAKDLAMHVAAMSPASVGELLQQPSIKDSDKTVSQLIQQVAEELREQITVVRFVRWDANHEPREPRPPEPPRSPAVIHRLRSVG